jgi:hypothetical protein
MEDYFESDEEQFTAPNQPTLIHPPPFNSSKGSMQVLPLKSPLSVHSIGEDGLAPWTPPKPTPSDRPPARLSSSDFSSLDRFPKSSVTSIQENTASPKSPVFTRLTEDTNRRTARTRRIQEFKSSQEEVPIVGRKASPAQAEAVYRRLSQDAVDRKVTATHMLTRRNEETLRRSVELRMPKEQEKQLIERLAEDAKRRAEIKQKQEKEKEESEVMKAVQMANSRHPPRPRDPTVLIRLQQLSPRPQPEPSPPPARIFTVQESELSGIRLMHAKKPSTVSLESPREAKLSPRQVEELVNRLYSKRSRVGIVRNSQERRKSSTRVQSPETRISSTVEKLWGDVETTLSKESTQGKELEDLDDLLLRLKARAVPEPRKAKVPQTHPTLSSPIRPKADYSEADLPKEPQLNSSPILSSTRSHRPNHMSLPSSPQPRPQHRLKAAQKSIGKRPQMSPLSLPASEAKARSRPGSTSLVTSPLQSYRFLSSSD